MGSRIATFVGAAGAACAIGWAAGVLPARPLLLTAGAAALVAMVLIGRQAWLHGRLTARLRATTEPAEVAGEPVRVGDLHGRAFVAGLARPHVFCDRGLLKRLSGAEARAVMLHERSHRRMRDPLRLTILAAVAPLVRRLPVGPELLARAAASREIAADRHALAAGASRRALAAALLKTAQTAVAHAPGFTPAVDLRLRALLGGTDAGSHRSLGRWAAAGLAAGAAVCLLVVHPASPLAAVACCG